MMTPPTATKIQCSQPKKTTKIVAKALVEVARRINVQASSAMPEMLVADLLPYRGVSICETVKYFSRCRVGTKTSESKMTPESIATTSHMPRIPLFLAKALSIDS